MIVILCSFQKVSRQNFHISVQQRRVYDITERKVCNICNVVLCFLSVKPIANFQSEIIIEVGEDVWRSRMFPVLFIHL